MQILAKKLDNQLDFSFSRFQVRFSLLATANRRKSRVYFPAFLSSIDLKCGNKDANQQRNLYYESIEQQKWD